MSRKPSTANPFVPFPFLFVLVLSKAVLVRDNDFRILLHASIPCGQPRHELRQLRISQMILATSEGYRGCSSTIPSRSSGTVTLARMQGP